MLRARSPWADTRHHEEKKTYTNVYYTQQDRHKKNPENKLETGKETKENSLTSKTFP
jgi:hypothetical protein